MDLQLRSDSSTYNWSKARLGSCHESIKWAEIVVLTEVRDHELVAVQIYNF